MVPPRLAAIAVEQPPWRSAQLPLSILHYYSDLGDVQMCNAASHTAIDVVAGAWR